MALDMGRGIRPARRQRGPSCNVFPCTGCCLHGACCLQHRKEPRPAWRVPCGTMQYHAPCALVRGHPMQAAALHGEHYLRLLAPLPAKGGQLVTRPQLVDVRDKGPGKVGAGLWVSDKVGLGL